MKLKFYFSTYSSVTRVLIDQEDFSDYFINATIIEYYQHAAGPCVGKFINTVAFCLLNSPLRYMFPPFHRCRNQGSENFNCLPIGQIIMPAHWFSIYSE